MTRSLLAHVVTKFGSQEWENIATASLHYILQRPGVEEGVLRALQSSGLNVHRLRWHTQYSSEDRSRPDLVGLDAEGRPQILIEVKFWAPLTDNQPNSYLASQKAAFPDQPEKRLLVFLVPRNRLHVLTEELRRRIQDDEEAGALAGSSTSQDFLLRHRVAVISWADLLRVIRSALTAIEDTHGLEDLNQLQGLCDRADAEAILPIAADEIDPVRARRIQEFYAITRDAVDRLTGSGAVSGDGLRWSNGTWGVVRFLKGPSGVVLGFGVYLDHWARHYPTPWWMEFSAADLTPAAREKFLQLKHDSDLPFVITLDNGNVAVAVPPPLGLEAEDTAGRLADFVTLVCAGLRNTDAAEG